MLDVFEDLTGAKRGEDDIINAWTEPNEIGIALIIIVEDDYENRWRLISSLPVAPGSIIDTGEYEEYYDGTPVRVLSKSFYPATDSADYNTPTEYKENPTA